MELSIIERIQYENIEVNKIFVIKNLLLNLLLILLIGYKTIFF